MKKFHATSASAADIHADATLRQFAVEFPGAFTKMVPLMVGIREALLAENIGRTQEEVADALAKRTSTEEYLFALLERGAMRRDLKGDEVEEVGVDDKLHALLRLLLQRDEARQEEVDELRREVRQLSDRLYEVERRGPE